MDHFELSEATIDDLDALVDVHESSMESDPVYRLLFRDVLPDTARSFIHGEMLKKFDLGYRKYFKITDFRTKCVELRYPREGGQLLIAVQVCSGMGWARIST